MYKVLLLISYLFICNTTFAGKVTATQALAKAKQFMQDKQLYQMKALRRARVKDTGNESAYYVFNVEGNEGFVIVSGDDRLPEILGYSDRGNIKKGSVPCNMEWLLDCYANWIDSLEAKGISQVYNPIRANTMAAIEPLITTQWGQDAPYNNLCPEIDGKKCLTGCVATAMAQIINYKKWPQGPTGKVDAYTSSGEQTLSMKELTPTSFDWDNMTDNDIARLMLYCGQSAQTSYGLTASGADVPENAFKYVFGYSKSLYKWLGKLFSAEHLEEHVYNELAEDRPVFYTGTNSEGGHAFVVDGYKDGLFHINWGWDGRNDGYFVLTASTEEEMPYPFNYNTYLLMGLEPASTKAAQAKVIARDCKYQQRSAYRENASDNFVYSTTFKSKLVCDIDNVSSYVGFGLYKGQELVRVLGEQEVTLPHTLKYSGNLGDIPVGSYSVVPIYRHQQTDEWERVTGSSQWFFTLHVGEHVYYIEDPVDEWNGDYQNYGIQEIDGVTYLLEKEFINWAKALPYQISGKYSGDIVIPNNVLYNGEAFSVSGVDVPAFDDCENLTTLSLAIDNRVQISNCPNLTQITLKQGLDIAISDCPKLESLEFPITAEWVFVRYCQNLKTMKFCSTRLAFGDVDWDATSLPSLTDVYFSSATPPNVSNMGEVNPKVTIHVPNGCLQDYQASQWGGWNIVDDQNPPFVTWGYCHDDEIERSGFVKGNNDRYEEFAMRIVPEDLSAYKGAKITHIQIFSPSRAVNDWGYENYEYVFITKRGTDYLTKQPFDVIRGAWNTVKLNDPYTITGDELFVGVGRHGQIGATYSDMTFVPDAAWGRAMGSGNSANVTPGEWDYIRECPLREGPSGIYAHPLPLRFAIEGEGIPEGVIIRELELAGENSDEESNASRLMATLHRAPEGVNTIQGVIRNRSKDVVSSYTIEWTVDGGEKQSRTIDTHLLPNATETITIDLPEMSNGVHSISTNVTMVNDNANKLAGLNMPTIYLSVKDGAATETSNISTINAAKDSVYDTRVFDLQGRRASPVEKGIYIRNKKKIIVPRVHH